MVMIAGGSSVGLLGLKFWPCVCGCCCCFLDMWFNRQSVSSSPSRDAYRAYAAPIGKARKRQNKANKTHDDEETPAGPSEPLSPPSDLADSSPLILAWVLARQLSASK